MVWHKFVKMVWHKFVKVVWHKLFQMSKWFDGSMSKFCRSATQLKRYRNTTLTRFRQAILTTEKLVSNHFDKLMSNHFDNWKKLCQTTLTNLCRTILTCFCQSVGLTEACQRGRGQLYFQVVVICFKLEKNAKHKLQGSVNQKFAKTKTFTRGCNTTVCRVLEVHVVGRPRYYIQFIFTICLKINWICNPEVESILG